VYERKTLSEGSPCGTIPSGNCWENVKRMAFLDFTSRSLERVNFAHFPNVRLLMIRMHQLEKKLVVELSGLTYLRSLVFEGSGLHLISSQGTLSFLGWFFPISTRIGGLVMSLSPWIILESKLGVWKSFNACSSFTIEVASCQT
jgi:hypothetical protein